jgi:hypothetical protein
MTESKRIASPLLHTLSKARPTQSTSRICKDLWPLTSHPAEAGHQVPTLASAFAYSNQPCSAISEGFWNKLVLGSVWKTIASVGTLLCTALGSSVQRPA